MDYLESIDYEDDEDDEGDLKEEVKELINEYLDFNNERLLIILDTEYNKIKRKISEEDRLPDSEYNNMIIRIQDILNIPPYFMSTEKQGNFIQLKEQIRNLMDNVSIFSRQFNFKNLQALHKHYVERNYYKDFKEQVGGRTPSGEDGIISNDQNDDEVKEVMREYIINPFKKYANGLLQNEFISKLNSLKLEDL